MSNAPQLIIEFPHVEVPDAEAARSVVAAVRATAAVTAARSVPLLLPEAPDGGGPGLDPGILAGILTADRRGQGASGSGTVIRSAGAPPLLIVTARTSRNAPFNLARRIQSLNRITGGLVGVFLRADGLDPVTSAAAPSPGEALDRSRLLGEYVEVLRRLWASFPEEALIGHREAGRFADPRSIVPAAFAGEVYAVAGALNVPLPSAHRTLLLADASAAGSAVDGVIRAASSSTGHTLDPLDSAGAPAYRTVTWIPGSAGAVSGSDGVVAGTADDALRALRNGPRKHVLLRVRAEAGQLPTLLDALFAVQPDHHESREVQAHAG
ncbi:MULTISPECIES: hypothetical protein [unclassified Pseudarthrobacter]|uniref:hypothetical protein n=1 Tax=unclassified Pseudarthrobacter TaxID=2647000 RepID=UPI003627F1BC